MKTTSSKRHHLWLLLLSISIASSAFAQENPANRVSPPARATGKIGTATITINYGSPSVKERKIWGDLVPYDKVWRAGANEATTFETDKDIQVEGKTLAAGKYAFFAIPGQNEWVIIFNKTADQWGAFKYDSSQDALRVKVKPHKSDKMNERLVYMVNDKGISLLWENIEVPVSITSR